MRLQTRSRRTAFAFAALAAALTVSAVVPSTASAAVSVGDTAPSFSLQDESGKSVSLSDFAGKIVVLEWLNPGCPFVQRHADAKTMESLDQDFSGKGVVWLGINSTHTTDNAADAAWVKKHDLTYPVLNDAAGTVGKDYGAKSTPDMFIINKDGKVAYMGAIDNDPDNDKSAADKVNYVRKALDELMSDQKVQTPKTRSYGCSVKYAS